MSEPWRVEAIAYGQPRPQGSKTYLSKGHARESSLGLPAWRHDVVRAIEDALPQDWTPRAGSVLALLDFAMQRPKYMVGRPTPPHLGKPDTDKLVRAVLDAATVAGLWCDDGQVVGIYAAKRYAEDGERAGVRMIFTQGC